MGSSRQFQSAPLTASMKYLTSLIASSIILMRRLVYAFLSMFHRAFQFSRPDVVVYCYHSIGEDDWRFTVSLSDIKRQIDLVLTEADPLTVDDMRQYLDGTLTLKRPGFLVTFDDGYRDILESVAYFRERGIRPIVFALSRPDAANREEMENNRPLLGADDFRTLSENGWSIGCHSATHAYFRGLDEAGAVREILEAKAELERTIGQEVSAFAYPKGGYTESVVTMVRNAGYALGFTVEHGIVSSYTDSLLIPRVGVDRTHSLAEFSVMSTVFGIRLKEALTRFVGKFL